MAKQIYRGTNAYLIYAEETTAYGTAGTPAANAYIDKVSSFTATLTNNFFRAQGIGEGRNATNAIPGALDCTGTMEWELTDPAFLQYCVIATKSGAGTAGDPFEIQELSAIGIAAGEVDSLTIEMGIPEAGTDDVLSFTGCVFNGFTISAEVGNTVRVTSDFIAQTVTSSTTTEIYSGPTNRPFVFQDGSVTVGSDTIGDLTAFSMTCVNNLSVYRALGSRLIKMPVPGVRRYDFSMTIKYAFDDTASVLSGTELRSLFFKGAAAQTTPSDTGDFTAVAVSLDLVEGAASGDRVVNIDFENCYFETFSEPISLDDNVIEVTVTGFALAGLTDGAVKVPIRWWTIT